MKISEIAENRIKLYIYISMFYQEWNLSTRPHTGVL